MKKNILILIIVFLFSLTFVNAVTDSDIYPYLQLQLTFETNITYSEEPSLRTVVCLSGNCPTQDGSIKKIGSYSASYDGINDMLTTAGEPKFIFGGNAGDDSICAWINPHTASYNTNDGWTGRFCSSCSDYWYVQIYSGGFISQLNLVGSGVSAGSITQDAWRFVCFTFTDSTDTLSAYLDGSFVTSSIIGTNMIDSSGGDLWIGGSGNGINRYKPMNIDNYIWVNKSLSTDEITYLYNSGNGRTINEIVTPTIAINEVNITNISRVRFTNNIQVLTPYYFLANATTDGLKDSSLTCNITGAVTDLFGKKSNSNFTLTNANSLEYSFYDELDDNPILKEVLNFRICRNGAIKDVNIYLNDNTTSYKILNSVIPRCTSGIHEEFNISSKTPQEYNNISIRCAGCVGVNTMTIIPIQNQYTLRFLRQHSRGNHELTYNSTDNLFWFDTHPHLFLENNTVKSFNITCNETITELNVNVLNIPPVSKINSINADGNEIPFIFNDTSIESSLQLEINGDCSEQLIQSVNFNVSYYVNNSLIKSSLTETINLTSTELSGNNKFKATLWCKDTDGQTSLTTKTFWVNDSVNPTMTILSPITNQNINTSASVSFLAQDKNIFGVNFTIDCLTQGRVFEYLNTSLTGTSFYYNGFTSNLTVNNDVCKITYEVCDDHTATLWTAESIKTDKTLSNITIENKQMISDYSVYDVEDLQFTQYKDKISYCYTYRTYEDSFITKNYKYRISKSDNWQFRSGTTYSNWDFKNWIDFDTDTGEIDSLTEDKDYFYVNVKSDFDTICFNSIGGINCISDNTDTFNVVTPVAPKVDEELTTGKGILLLILTVIYVSLLIIGLTFRTLIISSLALMLGVIMGLTLMTYSGLFGVTFILINFVMLVVFAKS